MEPEGSLPHSQAPANCPYPEPAQSSPHTHIPLTEDPSLFLTVPDIIKFQNIDLSSWITLYVITWS
jgi:hypothetical protein